MKKNIFLMMLIILFILPITYATYTVSYPYYMDVGVTYKFDICDTFSGNETIP